MERTVHILGIIALILSALLLPSAVVIVVAILLIAVWRNRMLVVAIGAALDAAFGVPIEAFGGFAYFYTALFALLAILSHFLYRALLE